MTKMLLQFIPVGICLASLCVPLTLGLWICYHRKNKKNPLTAQMLRAPGESINLRVEKLTDELNEQLFFTTIISTVIYSMYLTSKFVANINVSPLTYVFMAVVFLVISAVKLNRVVKQRHNELLGLDCERSVGQELNQLMLDGCRVFHDFQAENFNIDHIVIGQNGIFAIETKGRAKPDRGRGQEDVRVTYDGEGLNFPAWKEKEPLDQAKRQASWLSNWISQAVGEQVVVRPAIALPGWFVERKKQDFLIFNGKNPQFLTKIHTETPLSSVMIQRVSHQVEQQCRNVAPQAYKKN